MTLHLTLCVEFQNLVMFLSNVLDWLIPDIPKDISVRMKREKTLLVDVFLKEEREKVNLIESFLVRDRQKLRPVEVKKPRASSVSLADRSQRATLTSHSLRHTDV